MRDSIARMLGAVFLLLSLLNLRLGWLALRADRKEPANRYFAALSLVDAWAEGLRGVAVLMGQSLDEPWLVRLGIPGRLLTSYLVIGFAYSMARRKVPPRWLRAAVLVVLLGSLFLWQRTHHFGTLWLFALPNAVLLLYLITTGAAAMRARYGKTSAALLLFGFCLRLFCALLLLAAAHAQRYGLSLDWVRRLLFVERTVAFVVFDLLVGYAILRFHLFDIRGLAAEFVIYAGMAAMFVSGIVFSVHVILEHLYVPRPLLARVALTALCLLSSALLHFSLQLLPRLQQAVLLSLDPQHESRRQALAQARRELKKMHEELDNAQRLATLGTLAAAIAHDLRTPLTSVQMNVQILRQKVMLPPSDMEHFELALTELSRLDSHISELLDYAKPVRLVCEPADLRELCNDALSTQSRHLQERDLTVTRRYPAQLPPTSVDVERLRKVLTNLLSNAIGASPRGATIEIALAAIPDSSPTLPQGGVAITIEDHGRGISQEEMPRLFEPFYTTRTDGTGLGLSIVRKLVQAHGGEVQVRSQPGHGSAFTVVLPHREAPQPAAK